MLGDFWELPVIGVTGVIEAESLKKTVTGTRHAPVTPVTFLPGGQRRGRVDVPMRATLRRSSLSDLSRRSGLSVSYLSRLERRQRRPSVRTLERLARALETTPERVLEALRG